MSKFQVIVVLLHTVSVVCGIVCMSDARCRNVMTVEADEEAYCRFSVFGVGCCHARKRPNWSEWGAWSACTATCGSYGRHTRKRTCVGEGTCSGSSSETKACNSQTCPVDGYLSIWSDWTSCSQTCGWGQQTRSRDCYQPHHGGSPCQGNRTDKKACHIKPCPVDGYLEDWSGWGTCSQTCGWGQQTRSRDCHQPQYGGSPCQGNLTDKKTCRVRPCPVDGTLTDWEPWDHCSATCEGHRKRIRSCISPTNGGAPCKGRTVEIEHCGAHHCPVDGILRDWGPWGHCSATCEGNRNRIRVCIPPKNGGAPCTGSTVDTEQCGAHHCPVDGMLSVWGDWTPCSVTCGSGSRVRSRACIPPQYGGRDCNALMYETNACSLPPCPTQSTSTTQSSTTPSGLSCPTCNEQLECTWDTVCRSTDSCMVRFYPGYPFTTHCIPKDDCNLIKTLANSHGEIFCCQNVTCLHNFLGI